jgi:hypothetical protein
LTAQVTFAPANRTKVFTITDIQIKEQYQTKQKAPISELKTDINNQTKEPRQSTLVLSYKLLNIIIA